jgi:hypothetical protein
MVNTKNTQVTSENSGRAKILSLTLIPLVVLVVVVGASGCSTPSRRDVSANANAPQATVSSQEGTRPPAKTMGGAPPKALEDAGEYGENVYDMAKANDWSKAAAKLNLLKETATKLKSELQSGGGLDRLTSGITALDKAVTSKDRQAAMREANQITLIVANLNAPYKLAVPVEVTKLDYYGRELEIWSAEKDTGKLQATAAEMRRTWDEVRPAIESHKGAAEAKKFGELVAKVERAKTPDEYARLATPVLDEVDNLEKVFRG